MRITPEEFIRVWQAGNSVKEVSDQLHMSVWAAAGRAACYRRAGINVKMMPGGGRLDVKRLAKLAKEALA